MELLDREIARQEAETAARRSSAESTERRALRERRREESLRRGSEPRAAAGGPETGAAGVPADGAPAASGALPAAEPAPPPEAPAPAAADPDGAGFRPRSGSRESPAGAGNAGRVYEPRVPPPPEPGNGAGSYPPAPAGAPGEYGRPAAEPEEGGFRPRPGNYGGPAGAGDAGGAYGPYTPPPPGSAGDGAGFPPGAYGPAAPAGDDAPDYDPDEDFAGAAGDAPVPAPDDFAADDDDEADRENSVVYTGFDLSGSMSREEPAARDRPRERRRLVGGREVLTPSDLLGTVDDPYARDLAASGIRPENLVILASGVRTFGAAENDWIVTLPAGLRGFLDDRAGREIADAIRRGLGRDVRISFVYADAPALSGSPDDLCRRRYEEMRAREYRNITGDPGFAAARDALGLDAGAAALELVRPEEPAAS